MLNMWPKRTFSHHITNDYKMCERRANPIALPENLSRSVLSVALFGTRLREIKDRRPSFSGGMVKRGLLRSGDFSQYRTHLYQRTVEAHDCRSSCALHSDKISSIAQTRIDRERESLRFSQVLCRFKHKNQILDRDNSSTSATYQCHKQFSIALSVTICYI